MTSTEITDKAQRQGVTLELLPGRRLGVRGGDTRLRAAIDHHLPALVAYLSRPKMSAEELLADLVGRGARLHLEDRLLQIDAPVGTLTDTDRAAIQWHKKDLIRLARQQQEAAS